MRLRLFLLSCCALFCCMLLGLLPARAHERYVLPVDEAKNDDSFLSFRTKLIEAAKKRDKQFILSILDPQITSSFGGYDGIADFRKFWKFDNAKTEFWDEFLPVITSGGKFLDGAGAKTFCAPYSYAAFPDDLDAFTHSVIFGQNVNLRARPDLDAPVLSSLSYNIVAVIDSVGGKGKEEKPSWYEVKTLGGKRGFVSAAYVRSPIDYRACFQKTKGRWKMTAFVAGD